MQVSVIAVLPRQEPLLESAIASQEGRPSNIPLEAARTPPGMTIDPSMPAVAIGTGVLGGMTTESLKPDNSDSFAVKAFVDVAAYEDVPETMGGQQLFADPTIAPFITCGGTPPVGKASKVATLLKVPTLRNKGLTGDGVAIAIMDTGINITHLQNKLGVVPKFDTANSWQTPGNPTLPGQHPVHHGTMCAYDALIAAPKATLLDFPILRNNAPGGAQMSGTLSVALLAFAQLMASWAVSFAGGNLSKYKALVVSNSWGIFHPSWDFQAGHPGRFCDNPNHPFNGIVGALSRTNADIVFAAGNCGGNCADMRCQGRVTGAIMGSSALPEVLTVAGCDTNDARVGYSSQGPSIPGMFQKKPDVITYTHFLGSEAFGTGSADSGTSAACPVAAGCVAALRTNLPPAGMPSANLFSQINATARKRPGQTAWNKDFGNGYMDPIAAGQSLGIV